jgi:transposase InsO family protein
VVAGGEYSHRQACRYLGLARSTYQYEPKAPSEERLRLNACIVEESLKHPRWGYRKIHVMVQRRGFTVALCTVQLFRRRERLRVVTAQPRRRRTGHHQGKIKACGINDVWCFDFVFDTTEHGTTVKFLTVLDEFSHYCIVIVAARRMGSAGVIAALSKACELYGTPAHVRCDNGSEFIAGKIQGWFKAINIEVRYIDLGSPWQNGHNESFNGKFRDECLNRELYGTDMEAQCIVDAYREEYNTIRPHQALSYKTPAEFRAHAPVPITPPKGRSSH